MGLLKYSIEVDEKKEAKSQAHDLDASWKDFTNICRAIKNKSVEESRKILDGAISMKMPIRYVMHNTGLGHRSQLGGKKGRFPKKEAKIMLKLLGNAVSNANQKGLDEKKLFVKFAAANKQNTMKRYRKFWATGATLGYGKQAVWANYETCKVELVLAQREPRAKKKRDKGNTPAGQKQEAKPAVQPAKEAAKPVEKAQGGSKIAITV